MGRRGPRLKGTHGIDRETDGARHLVEVDATRTGLSLSIGMGLVTLRVRRRTCIHLDRSVESCMQRNIS